MKTLKRILCLMLGVSIGLLASDIVLTHGSNSVVAILFITMYIGTMVVVSRVEKLEDRMNVVMSRATMKGEEDESIH